MDDPGVTRVDVHVTGFGAFHGVEDNPTSRLVRALPAHLDGLGGPPPTWRLASAGVVHVSRRGCREALDSIEASADSDTATRPQVWLHFGVAGGRPAACLETTAYNEAVFRCPDEDGDSPDGEPVIEALDPSAPLATRADAEAARALLEARGHLVACSDDPGRFVCNWMAMASMHRASKRRAAVSLFCHMPESDIISDEDALRLAIDLIGCLADQAAAAAVRPADAPGPG